VALYTVALWGVVTLVFVLPRLLPGDPLQSLSDPTSGSFLYDPTVRAKIAAYYGLNKPLLNQYLAYLSALSHGQLGWSISQNMPVTTIIERRLPWTLLLMGTALGLSSAISFLAGVTAAWRRGDRVDRGLIVSLSAARTIPEYAMASLLLLCFAVLVPVLPLAGAQTPFASYSSTFAAVGDVARHLVLPVLALTAGLAGNKFLIVRNAVISTLGEDYMLLARAKGLPRRRLKYHHAGRNAMLPFVTAVGIQTGFAVGGALFVETVFSYPGMGTLMNNALSARDYPLLQGSFLVLSAVVLAVNFCVELAYGRLDPRVRA
jgi:peptide/nickel transport system permease protein